MGIVESVGSQLQDAGWGASMQNQGKMRHILCYGDNLTFGFCSGGQQSKPYAAALSDSLKAAGIACKVSVGGLSGHTAKQMVLATDRPSITDSQGRVLGRGLGRILDEDGPFDLVIIMAGTNDLSMMSRSDEIVANLRFLHEAAHRRGVPTVALAPPSPQRKAQVDLAKLLAQWVQTSDSVLTYANVEEFVPRQTASSWEPDNVHFSPSGSALLGKRMMAHLLPVMSYLGWGEAAAKAAIEVAMEQQRRGAARANVGRGGA